MIGWLDLKSAAAYTSLSVRTLRRYIGDLVHPLPVYQVGGKWLMRPEDLDRWIEGFQKGRADIEKFVDEILDDVHIGERPRWEKRGPRRGL